MLRRKMTQSDSQEVEPPKEESFISHLVELRSRLLRMLIGVLAVFLCLFPFANPIYSFLAGPLTRHLPAGSSMIAIDVASPFLVPFKLVLMLAVVIAVPWILYQAWAFVAPGLYRHERRLVFPILVSGTVLFYAGMAFAYYVMFPLAFGFLLGTAPEGVAVMTDIARYLDFVLVIFLAFGIAFQVPVVTIVLVILDLVTPQDLAAKRPYVIVGAFIIGAFLTPPDVISQTLLAVPIWLLFELGLLFSKLMVRRKLEGEHRTDGA
jgi:sec-independent protein translocase protein TatC